MSCSYFSMELFDFLNELRTTNSREWFQTNKDRYIRVLKEPALAFISDFAPMLATISPHFRSDPRPVGGSLFRIHRDVRFSKDKSPYKTHAGLHFRHEAGKSAHTPGFYLHLEPGGSFVGVGLWRPDGPTLKEIRDRIAEKPKAWLQAVEGPEFTKSFTVHGERLKRPPRGFDPEHEMVEALKLKDITAFSPLSEDQVTESGFIENFANFCRQGSPLVKFICTALEQPF